MPKSFLIKRAHKVNTGFFPWNIDTLVPGCCLEYEEEEDNHSDGKQVIFFNFVLWILSFDFRNVITIIFV